MHPSNFCRDGAIRLQRVSSRKITSSTSYFLVESEVEVAVASIQVEVQSVNMEKDTELKCLLTKSHFNGFKRVSKKFTQEAGALLYKFFLFFIPYGNNSLLPYS